MAMIDRLKRSIFTTASTKKTPDVKSWFVNKAETSNPKLQKIALKIITGVIMDIASSRSSVRSDVSAFVSSNDHIFFCNQLGMDHKKLGQSIRKIMLEVGVRKKKVAKDIRKEIVQEYSSLESS